MNDDKRLACARLSDSIVGTYYNEQSENKTRATWEMERWLRGKWEREPCLPPALARFSISFYTFWLTERLFTTILGAWNRIPFVQSVPFTEKRPRRPETGIKFLFVIFHQEKQDYLFRSSVAPGNFPLGRPKKSCSMHLLSVRISRNIFVNGGC